MRSLYILSRRYVSSAVSKPWISSFEKVLSVDPFKNSALATASHALEPYEFSSIIKQSLSENSEISVEERVKIHNLLIEELTKHDFAVATIHLKELQKLSGSVTIPAFIELIKYNPGRVKTSWEIFVENFEMVKGFDEPMILVLEKLVTFDDAELRDGKAAMNSIDIARSIFLLDFIKNKGSIPENIWNKLKNDIISSEASVFLPKVLEFSRSSNSFEVDVLSKFQLYYLLGSGDLKNLFYEDKDKFVKFFALVGTEDSITLSERENDVYQSVIKELGHLHQHFGLGEPASVPTVIKTQDSFERLIDFVELNELDKKDLSYAKMLIRYLGLHKGDIKRAMESYHNSLMSHPSHSDELMYELFLSFVNQAFVNSNDRLLNVAETLIPSGTTAGNKLSILRALILVNSKFNLDSCLEIFNSNMKELSREKSPVTGTSDAALLCEALIMAHLRNKDRDFAHVVFEGAAREKIVDGPTAIKRVKTIFTLYGESIEEENFTEIMDREIERIFKTL